MESDITLLESNPALFESNPALLESDTACLEFNLPLLEFKEGKLIANCEKLLTLPAHMLPNSMRRTSYS